MDAKLSAVPLVAVRDREAHHPGARFEVRHTSAQPMVDRAGTNVAAPGDLPLADPSAACVVSAPKPQRFPVWNVVTETSPRGRGFAADMNPIDLVFEVLPAAFQSKVILWELEDPTPSQNGDGLGVDLDRAEAIPDGRPGTQVVERIQLGVEPGWVFGGRCQADGGRCGS